MRGQRRRGPQRGLHRARPLPGRDLRNGARPVQPARPGSPSTTRTAPTTATSTSSTAPRRMQAAAIPARSSSTARAAPTSGRSTAPNPTRASSKTLGWTGGVSVDDNGFVWVTGGPVMKYTQRRRQRIRPRLGVDLPLLLGSLERHRQRQRHAPAGRRLRQRRQRERPTSRTPSGRRVVDHLPCGGYLAGGTAFDRATGNFLVGNGGEVCEFTQKGVLLGKFGGGILSSRVRHRCQRDDRRRLRRRPGHGHGLRLRAPGRPRRHHRRPDRRRPHERDAHRPGRARPDGRRRRRPTATSKSAPTPPMGPTSPACRRRRTRAPRAVTADVSGLTTETTYHYRLVAANSVDSTAGADKTFTPHAVIGLRTDPATDLTQISATLNGSFDPNGEVTHVHFEWGADNSYGNVTPNRGRHRRRRGSKGVTAPIEGLQSFTPYHYRIVARKLRRDQLRRRHGRPHGAARTADGLGADGVRRHRPQRERLRRRQPGLRRHGLRPRIQPRHLLSPGTGRWRVDRLRQHRQHATTRSRWGSPNCARHDLQRAGLSRPTSWGRRTARS